MESVERVTVLPEDIKQIRILVSCPSDVEKEVKILKNVVYEINKEINSRNLHFDIWTWIEDSTPGFGEDSQEVINNQIKPYDVFIGIMWTRFGTPTKRANSGTEEEYNRALSRWLSKPNSVDIMMYFNVQAVPYDVDTEQLKKVKEFRQKIKKQGALFCDYNGRKEYEKKINRHLRNIIVKWDKLQRCIDYPLEINDIPDSNKPDLETLNNKYNSLLLESTWREFEHGNVTGSIDLVTALYKMSKLNVPFRWLESDTAKGVDIDNEYYKLMVIGLNSMREENHNRIFEYKSNDINEVLNLDIDVWIQSPNVIDGIYNMIIDSSIDCTDLQHYFYSNWINLDEQEIQDIILNLFIIYFMTISVRRYCNASVSIESVLNSLFLEYDLRNS